MQEYPGQVPPGINKRGPQLTREGSTKGQKPMDAIPNPSGDGTGALSNDLDVDRIASSLGPVRENGNGAQRGRAADVPSPDIVNRGYAPAAKFKPQVTKPSANRQRFGINPGR